MSLCSILLVNPILHIDSSPLKYCFAFVLADIFLLESNPDFGFARVRLEASIFNDS